MNITIKEKNGKHELPLLSTVIDHLTAGEGKLSMTFEGGTVDEGYRKKLQSYLPRYHVSNIRYNGMIRIVPALETAKLLKVMDDVHQAGITFRQTGIELMETLGTTHNIDPYDLHALNRLKFRSRANKQRGVIDDQWNFWFHGAECQFSNHATGQIIELVIDYCPEFGALDSFFFFRYIDTTPAYKELSKFFNEDWKSLTKALDLLEDQGRLKRIDENSHRGIVAI